MKPQIKLEKIEAKLHDDIYKIVDWLNDKFLMRYSEQRHGSHDVISQLDFISRNDDNGLFYRGIYADGNLVGTLTAGVDQYNQGANLGILIGPEYANMGIGTEAWCLMMQLLHIYGIKKIEAGMMSENKAMESICQKANMTLEATVPNHFILDGHRISLIQYGHYYK